MNVLLINCILCTAEKGVIPKRKSIKDTMICNYAMGFVANGDQVTILASEEYRPTEHETYPFEVVYFKSRFPKLFKPDLLPWPVGMRKYLKENLQRFDMVVSSEVFSMASLIAANVCGDKLIIWHELAKHQKFLFTIPARLWYNVVVPLLIRKPLVVPRSEAAYDFVKRYVKNISKETVEHGANEAVLRLGNTVRDEFIVLSQLIPRKRIDRIIRKFTAFISDSRYSHYVLNVVGDGECKESLMELCRELGVDKNVIFYGFMCHKEMAEVLRVSKALLIDTEQDNNMVSISESVVCGTPVLTNMCPTNAKFIAQCGVGIALDGWNCTELREIADRYELYHKACIEVREEFTNLGCARKMKLIYNNWVTRCGRLQ